jgi:SlyX protein
MNENAQRIIELEIKVAYQDDLLQTLNSIVSEQQQQLNRVEATCRLLYERLTSLASKSQGEAEQVNEIPPHY